jgi:hypothetical protein
MSVRRSESSATCIGVLCGLLCLLVPAACGPEDPGQEGRGKPERLGPAERREVNALEAEIAAHCIAVARSLVDPRTRPSRAEERRAFSAADRLLELARRKPRAPLGAGQDLRLFVSDVAENLEGSNCDPRMIARLERGLRGIPQG